MAGRLLKTGQHATLTPLKALPPTAAIVGSKRLMRMTQQREQAAPWFDRQAMVD